uniref:Uncharacterized protein n=1 Tax=Corvus moneduloides TaxID=1196302 RepID=A0A8C3DZU3_CORMO
MDCGVPVEPRNATGLQSAAGLWLCRSGSQHCWDWSAFAAGLGGGWVVPHASGGRAGAHPAQPRGVPGWGCPGRSLRTRRGRPAPPAAFPQEEEEEEEEEVAAEQERRWKEWERDSSDGTGGTWLCPPAVEEQVGDPGSCCAAGMDRPHNLPPLPELSDSSLLPGKLRRGRQRVLGEKQWRSLEERGSAQLGQPKLTRSRTYESSCKETEQEATGRQGPPSPSLSKQDSSYRRAFGELAEQNVLLGCFSCAWQREVPYHGRLYVSSHHICFHSNLLLKDIKAVVPVDSITALKKTNMARLVPNAISIRTAKGEKFLFVSLRQREATYQLLRSVCKHLQDSGQSPRDSVGSEETLRKSPILKQSGLEQSTPEPNSLQESLDEPSPRSRQAEEEDDEVALLVPSSSEWVPSAGTRGLWGGSRGSGWGDDAGGLHPGRAEHGLSVPLTLPCPGRGTPHGALHLGHCTLVPDTPPAEPSQHHHHHLSAAVSPQDLLTPLLPIPTEPRHSLSRVALAGRGSRISPGHPSPGRALGSLAVALLLPHVPTLCPLADAGLSPAWWPCCCPRGTSVCASWSWSSSWHSWGLSQTSTCHSSEWGAWGDLCPQQRPPPSPCLPSGTRQREASEDPATSRAPAGGSGAAPSLPWPLRGLCHRVPSSPPRCLGSPRGP